MVSIDSHTSQLRNTCLLGDELFLGLQLGIDVDDVVKLLQEEPIKLFETTEYTYTYVTFYKCV